MTPTTYLTTGQVAARLNVPRWQLAYLIERGDVPGPSVEIPGRRLFTEADVEAIGEALARRCAAARGDEGNEPTGPG
jgi:DNA-binding transcriptional MerR regulator